MGSYSLTASSVGTAATKNLDWQAAKYTSYGVTGSSSGTFTYTIEGTLDDLQFVTAPTWFAMSSATTTNSSLSQYQGPLAAIRLNVSALSSAVLSMDILQGIGG